MYLFVCIYYLYIYTVISKQWFSYFTDSKGFSDKDFKTIETILKKENKDSLDSILKYIETPKNIEYLLIYNYSWPVLFIEYTSLFIYTIEMIFKMFAYGCHLKFKKSYFRSSWNVLDFIIIIVSYLGVILNRYADQLDEQMYAVVSCVILIESFFIIFYYNFFITIYN